MHRCVFIDLQSYFISFSRSSRYELVDLQSSGLGLGLVYSFGPMLEAHTLVGLEGFGYKITDFNLAMLKLIFVRFIRKTITSSPIKFNLGRF